MYILCIDDFRFFGQNHLRCIEIKNVYRLKESSTGNPIFTIQGRSTFAYPISTINLQENINDHLDWTPRIVSKFKINFSGIDLMKRHKEKAPP